MTATTDMSTLIVERDTLIKGIVSSKKMQLGESTIKRQEKFLAIVEEEIAALQGEKKNTHAAAELTQDDLDATTSDQHAHAGIAPDVGDNSVAADLVADSLDGVATEGETNWFVSKEAADEYQAYKKTLQTVLLNYLKRENKSIGDKMAAGIKCERLVALIRIQITAFGRNIYVQALLKKKYYFTHNGKRYDYGFDLDVLKKTFDF